MQKRRRFKHTETLQDRLASFAEDARANAWALPAGTQRDDLLRRARRADIAAHLEDWANSPGLRSPNR
jgi:hypothetical protein